VVVAGCAVVDVVEAGRLVVPASGVGEREHDDAIEVSNPITATDLRAFIPHSLVPGRLSVTGLVAISDRQHGLQR